MKHIMKYAIATFGILAGAAGYAQSIADIHGLMKAQSEAIQNYKYRAVSSAIVPDQLRLKKQIEELGGTYIEGEEKPRYLDVKRAGAKFRFISKGGAMVISGKASNIEIMNDYASDGAVYETYQPYNGQGTRSPALKKDGGDINIQSDIAQLSFEQLRASGFVRGWLEHPEFFAGVIEAENTETVSWRLIPTQTVVDEAQLECVLTFDKTKGLALVSQDLYTGGRLRQRHVIDSFSEVVAEDGTTVYIPLTGKLMSYDGSEANNLLFAWELVIEDFAQVDYFDESEFKIDFPPGTRLIDSINGDHYVIGELQSDSELVKDLARTTRELQNKPQLEAPSVPVTSDLGAPSPRGTEVSLEERYSWSGLGMGLFMVMALVTVIVYTYRRKSKRNE